MDETTAGGYPPEYVAEQILNGVVLKDKEMVIATAGPRYAIFLRSLFPSMFFWIMEKRANKMVSVAQSRTTSSDVRGQSRSNSDSKAGSKFKKP